MNDWDPEDRLRFEQLVLPHIDNAFNLARWLLRSCADAEDVAREALLRACRFFRGFHGGDARAWLLQIVRNTSYSWLEKNRPRELMVEFDEELHPQSVATLESIAIADQGRECLSRAIETLPPRHREVLVFRQLEGRSYQEDCGDYVDSHWYGHVLAPPSPPPIAFGAGKLDSQGGCREV